MCAHGRVAAGVRVARRLHDHAVARDGPIQCHRHNVVVHIGAVDGEAQEAGAQAGKGPRGVRRRTGLTLGTSGGLKTELTPHHDPPPTHKIPYPLFSQLVPTRACTGVDSSDPLCTGSKAEYWWGAAFDEAVLYGIAPGPLAAHPPPPSTTLPVWDLDLPVAPNTPSWGVAINSANRRSQHQTHIRFAKWQPTAADWSGGAGAYSNILPAWLAIETFSVDVANPTRTGPASPVVVAETTQWPLIATVFVATGAKPDAGAAKVWATAATVAHGLDPARPYGIMIAPRWQAKLGPGGGPVVPGVTVSAVFDIGASQILDETPNPNDCVGTCEVWNRLWWEGKGARPQPLLFKSWAQAARVDASAAVNDCDLPPVPAGYTTKEWHEKLGLSW